MKKKPAKKTALRWIIEHVRPHVKFQGKPSKLAKKDRTFNEITGQWEDRIRKHSILGIKLKWRF